VRVLHGASSCGKKPVAEFIVAVAFCHFLLEARTARAISGRSRKVPDSVVTSNGYVEPKFGRGGEFLAA
jgi:hypothetical protein